MRSPLGLTPPAWVSDDEFDIHRHVLFNDDVLPLDSTNLPQLTGLSRGVLSLAHPLWRATLTELADGDVALGVVMHHVVGDALFTLKMLSAMTVKAPDPALPAATTTVSVVRAPRRGGELPWLAFRAWAAAQPSLRAGWRSYWSAPLRRRVRRVGGRMLRPLRTALAHGRDTAFARLPARHSDFRTMPSADVSGTATELGCTMSDLLIASVIRSAPGTEPEVGLRVPIAVRRSATDGARNSVVDLEVRGLRDWSPRDVAAAVRAQLPARPGDAPPAAGQAHGHAPADRLCHARPLAVAAALLRRRTRQGDHRVPHRPRERRTLHPGDPVRRQVHGRRNRVTAYGCVGDRRPTAPRAHRCRRAAHGAGSSTTRA